MVMTTWAWLRCSAAPMVDRTQPPAAHELSPGPLHALQLFVAESEVGGTQVIVVAVHDEVAVELGERLDVRLIDARVTVLDQPHVPAQGVQFAYPPAV